MHLAAANAAPGADVITFNLSGCPCSIFLLSTLTITEALTINGPGMAALTLFGLDTVQVINATVGCLPLPTSRSATARRRRQDRAEASIPQGTSWTRVTVRNSTAPNYGGGFS